jgi:hypothetical protein
VTERRARGFIGEVLMAITREKSTGVLLRRPFPETERERRLQEEEEGDLTGRAHMSVRRKRDQGYRFRFELGGPWAACGTGPIRIPGDKDHAGDPMSLSRSFTASQTRYKSSNNAKNVT